MSVGQIWCFWLFSEFCCALRGGSAQFFHSLAGTGFAACGIGSASLKGLRISGLVGKTSVYTESAKAIDVAPNTPSLSSRPLWARLGSSTSLPAPRPKAAAPTAPARRTFRRDIPSACTAASDVTSAPCAIESARCASKVDMTLLSQSGCGVARTVPRSAPVRISGFLRLSKFAAGRLGRREGDHVKPRSGTCQPAGGPMTRWSKDYYDPLRGPRQANQRGRTGQGPAKGQSRSGKATGPIGEGLPHYRPIWTPVSG